jgi:hypothetical protein
MPQRIDGRKQPTRASGRKKNPVDYKSADWSGSSSSEEEQEAAVTLPTIPENESTTKPSIGVPNNFDFNGAREDEMFEEEDNGDNANEDPTPTQNDAAQNDPKKKKTPAKKSPAMKVAMPDSTERVSTSHQVATTAHKTSKKSATKKGGPRLTKNCRIYVKQNIVLKIVPPNLHSHVKSFGNNKTRKFYGTCLPKAKSDGTGYRLKLDDFEAPNNIFKFSRRSFEIVPQGEEENLQSRDEAEEEMAEILAEADNADGTNRSSSRRNYQKESQQEFLDLSCEDQATAKTYEMKYGSREDQVILWTILSPDEQVVTCAMEEYGRKKAAADSAAAERDTATDVDGGDSTTADTGAGVNEGETAPVDTSLPGTDRAGESITADAVVPGVDGEGESVNADTATGADRAGESVTANAATGMEREERGMVVANMSRQTDENQVGVGNNGKFISYYCSHI